MVGSRDLSAMDIETSEAIETLRADLRQVEVTLSVKIGTSVEASASTLRGEMGLLRGEMGQLRAEVGQVRAETGQLRAEVAELRGDMTGVRGEMAGIRGEMSSMREELMRHSQVLHESLRGDIRMIAEGFVTLDRKVESLRRPADLQ